ncbi:(2Fe-2S)-binding protein [Paracoccus sp. S1E-3]|uniref:(2Fe-2S)-binding protein n=1 Tax=Paracoccus sp. S1E-3 TaxID=2756130 RepID=UPI0015EEAC4A|nr:(2Fe-2S)-binding protein [Paracoccus sp. S1E-3]MBA4489836.1 (2Fe-2S)-binding protein [Paracoccus sp. S1E-3]
MATTLKVNGAETRVDAAPETPLLYALRDDLGLNGPKYGCGLGQCGACTVLVDGRAVLSCVTPISVIGSRAVETVEGLGTAEAPGPVQRAFIELQAMQCGYCIPGMMMRTEALLRDNPDPQDHEIRAAFQTNLCRCGTHMRIMKAIRRAAELYRDANPVQEG